MKKIITLGFLALVLALTGCETPVNEAAGNKGGDDTGTVRVSLSSGPLASAMPAVDGLFYILTFSAEGVGEPIVHELVGGVTASLDIPQGEWRLTVNAFCGESDTPILRGTAELNVTVGQAVPANVALGPVLTAEGRGTLQYSVSFPEGLTSAGFKLYTFPAHSEKQNVDLLGHGTEEGTIDSLDAGFYSMSFSFANESVTPKRSAGAVKIINVINGLTANVSYTFTDDADFYDEPVQVPAAVIEYETFDSIAEMGEYLEAAGDNTIDTPYYVALSSSVDVTNWKSRVATNQDPLDNIFAALNGKYVWLNLSECTVLSTGLTNTTNTNSNNRVDKDKLVGVILPTALPSVSSYAFAHCTSLKYVDIPSVLSGNCFRDCTSLETVIIRAVSNPTVTSANNFTSANQFTLYVDDAQVERYSTTSTSSTVWQAATVAIKPLSELP
jgi:hypothetical protein